MGEYILRILLVTRHIVSRRIPGGVGSQHAAWGPRAGRLRRGSVCSLITVLADSRGDLLN
jgi:hypothetical protein